MTPDPMIFRTSGIRGRANEIITPELALRIGRAFATWIKKTYNSDDYYIYLGYDNRRNSHAIANCLAAALNSSGINVIQFAVPVPTPLVIHATTNNQSHGGIMVTGSHLPATDNGIILFDHQGNYYKGLLEDSNDIVDWSDLGKTVIAKTEIDEYRLFLVQQAEKLGVTKTNWKILIDTVHGPMFEYIKLAALQISDDLHYINETDDDTFPGRASEPSPKSLLKTRDKLLEIGADIAICTDMDGDRVLFIEKSGRIVTGDYLGAILSNLFWDSHKELPVVAPINTSGILAVAASSVNGKIHFCNVGPPSIIDAIRETKAKFGFEETGKYMFSDIGIWPDSAISTLFLAALIQKSGKTLDQFVDELPVLISKKEKIPSPRKLSDNIMKNLISQLNSDTKTLKEYIERLNDSFNFTLDSEEYSLIINTKILSINTMDGLRVNLDNSSYFMIRPSGTENYIRIFCEHPDEKSVIQLSSLGDDIIRAMQKYQIN